MPISIKAGRRPIVFTIPRGIIRNPSEKFPYRLAQEMRFFFLTVVVPLAVSMSVSA
jgi:hypothetical protein